MAADSSDLFTVAEAAEFLNVPRSWVYNRTTDDDFPALKLGGHVRVPRDALLQRVLKHRVMPAA